jgi:fatty acid desaturase
MKILAYSPKDWIPVVAQLLQTAYLVTMFLVFPYTPWWLLLVMGLVYSVSISWNLNGIAHNLIHNPYFSWKPLNWAFSWLLSVTSGLSQQFHEVYHYKHHQGNSDRSDEHSDTVDLVSIYRHGHDGEPENPWTYIFLSFLRDDPKLVFQELKKRRPFAAYFAVFEIASWASLCLLAFFLNWKFMMFYLPFYYFGHCLSYLNGYFLHYGGNPDVPLAWGVSSYNKFYNLLWFNNGYHAEHHYKPKVHWTKMHELHLEIREQQKAAKVRVIKPPHALGFLDPDLPKRTPTVKEPTRVPGTS